jgi:hypothetical protein
LALALAWPATAGAAWASGATRQGLDAVQCTDHVLNADRARGPGRALYRNR